MPAPVTASPSILLLPADETVASIGLMEDAAGLGTYLWLPHQLYWSAGMFRPGKLSA